MPCPRGRGPGFPPVLLGVRRGLGVGRRESRWDDVRLGLGLGLGLGLSLGLGLGLSAPGPGPEPGRLEDTLGVLEAYLAIAAAFGRRGGAWSSVSEVAACG